MFHPPMGTLRHASPSLCTASPHVISAAPQQPEHPGQPASVLPDGVGHTNTMSWRPACRAGKWHLPFAGSCRGVTRAWEDPAPRDTGRTLEIPDMMMVLFLRGDLTFSFEDSLSWRMATSATGSEPLSTSSSAGGRGR